MIETLRLDSDLRKDEVLEQLDRILADKRFSLADRNSRFLRHVVQRTLDGKTAEIKEVVIATEIYGRSTDYDPKVDSIVRVEATRLRSKLHSYYEQQGMQDPIRITIAKGSYVPQFERVLVPEETTPEVPAAEVQQQDRTGQSTLKKLSAVRPWSAFILSGFVAVLWLAWGSAYAPALPRGAGERTASAGPHPDALAAWQEGNELLRQDPHSAVLDKGMPPTLERAIERFELAVAKAPSFARGWASLAESYEYASAYVGRDRVEDSRRAEAAARRAVALDKNLPAAHAMLGLVLFYLRWDFAAAEAAYRRAIELDPRSAFTIVEYADLLLETGRPNEAEVEIRKARALLPKLPVLAIKEAEIQVERNQADAAIATATAVLQWQQDNRRAHVALGMALQAKGDFVQAEKSYRTALVMNQQDRRALPALGHLLGLMGRRKEALAVARQLEEMNARVRNCGFQVALVYVGLGENERALDWLERAYRTRQMHVPFMAVEHRFLALREHPRFRAILSRVGLQSLPAAGAS